MRRHSQTTHPVSDAYGDDDQTVRVFFWLLVVLSVALYFVWYRHLSVAPAEGGYPFDYGSEGREFEPWQGNARKGPWIAENSDSGAFLFYVIPLGMQVLANLNACTAC